MEDGQNDTILKISDLTVAFDHVPVISHVNFEVKRGEVMAIIGPNGAGKSVLLRTLLGLLPYHGSVDWNKDSRIGYVPQKLFVEPGFPLSVGEFLGFKSNSIDEITEVLESVGIKDQPHDHLPGDTKPHRSHFLDHRLGFLSGGELQRVLIAWSLIGNPNVLLFDEPTSGIDIGGEETIYKLLRELQKKRNLTIILISHDLNIIYKYADTVLCINNKQICFGAPKAVLDPESLSTLYGGEPKFYKHDGHNS